MYPKSSRIAHLLTIGCLLPSQLYAEEQRWPLDGHRALILADRSGTELEIGSVTFTTQPTGANYSLEIDHHKFQDYFLSMKEMKCLEGPELWCHLPYPYENPRVVTEESTDWLSHDLLFMFKKPDEFGANFWNGIYYKIWIEDDELVGLAQAVDLNLLASPPGDLSTPPIGIYDREDIDPNQRWLPKLIIR